MPPGRRLRLDRRKALLDQAGLAKLLGCTIEEVSKMEQNKIDLSPAAEAFIANTPRAVPAEQKPKPASKDVPLPPEPPVDPDAVIEQEAGDGGPQTAPEDAPAGRGDKPPKPLGPGQLAATKPRKDEIVALEAALLTFFAGEVFLVPREMPDGTVIQAEAVIPGLAQFIGMVDPFDGQIIRTYAPGMARAWAQLAEQNPTVLKWLNAVTYGGAYRGVIAATLPALMAIVMHHGLLGNIMGGPAQVVEHPVADQPPEVI